MRKDEDEVLSNYYKKLHFFGSMYQQSSLLKRTILAVNGCERKQTNGNKCRNLYPSISKSYNWLILWEEKNEPQCYLFGKLEFNENYK